MEFSPVGFNPCFNGMSLKAKESKFVKATVIVLILVVMECL